MTAPERVRRRAVLPELRGPLRLLPPLPVGSATGRRALRALTGLQPPARVPGVTVSDERAGSVPVRVHLPQQRRSAGALLWLHGGGLVFGRAVQDDRLCGETARDLGIVVVAVDYRLAPEHPFPAPLDDCLTAWTWLQERRQDLGVDPGLVAVGGASAGGGLAAALAQRLRDLAEDQPGEQPAAQWLLCPMLDDRTAARRDLDAVGHPVWDNRRNRAGWGAYLGTDPGSAEPPPYAVPARRDDLTGLPPAWVGVGDVDLFHDEDREYTERLRAAGVPAELHVVAGGPHGFESWAPGTTVTHAYLAAARRWLDQTLTGQVPQKVW